MAINYVLLGKRISGRRVELKLSQEQLAEMLFVSRSLIASIELGRKRPSIDTIVDIANALRTSADDLLVDSLQFARSDETTPIFQLLLDCTPDEKNAILRISKVLKEILNSYGI